jgi:SAM-dependent methyltransferase
METQEKLTDVARYLAARGGKPLQGWVPQYENLLRVIGRLKPVDPTLKMLEVGTGTGWFPILCKHNGLQCKGLEISQELVDFAREYGNRYGVAADIEVGNVEEASLGTHLYDIIVCSSVFEHVRDWRKGLAVVFRALKPGGVLFFESTNKFSLTSGEYPQFPLYGWLPNPARFGLRKMVHGPDIMELGIDFHQFRYGQLRAEFRRLGFRRILDRVDIADPANVPPGKRRVLAICKRNRLARNTVLAFFEMTTFLCQK